MENVAPIITAIGAMLAIFGAGAKWLIGYLDKKAAAAAAREDAARKALADRFKSEIDQLRREVENLFFWQPDHCRAQWAREVRAGWHE